MEYGTPRTDIEDIIGQIFSSEPAPFVGKNQYVFKISDLVSADGLTAGVGQLIFIFIEKDKVDIFSGKESSPILCLRYRILSAE